MAIGTFESRLNPNGTWDILQPDLGREMRLAFDPIAGCAYVLLVASCSPGNSGLPCTYSPTPRFIRICGFTQFFEIEQTYTPPTGFAFQVPLRPEALAAVDHFDTYWGNLTHPLDFTQAHPLACGYPTAQPHVGDYLTVADTVPTPAPGQGVYYVTSATYQGATRYGRKTTAGHLSGRDPAALPVCTP